MTQTVRNKISWSDDTKMNFRQFGSGSMMLWTVFNNRDYIIGQSYKYNN